MTYLPSLKSLHACADTSDDEQLSQEDTAPVSEATRKATETCFFSDFFSISLNYVIYRVQTDQNSGHRVFRQSSSGKLWLFLITRKRARIHVTHTSRGQRTQKSGYVLEPSSSRSHDGNLVANCCMLLHHVRYSAILELRIATRKIYINTVIKGKGVTTVGQ